jgi:hypothetical protein
MRSHRLDIEILLLGMLALMLAGSSRADSTSTYTDGAGWNLLNFSTGKILNLAPLKDKDACIAAGNAWTNQAAKGSRFKCDPLPGVLVTTYTAGPALPTAAAPAPVLATDSTFRVQPFVTDNPASLPGPSDIGSFRVPCAYSHMAFDDPIIFPGKQGASHLHTFFGNRSADFASTTESLLAANASTCAGGTVNLSSYWMPAMVNTVTRRALVPTEFMVYYKKGYNGLLNAEITIPPNGLRMIGGRSATATAITDADFFTVARFSCDGGAWQNTIPACAAGHQLHTSLDFPNCWDGKNLDSPDHRSHMASTQGQPARDGQAEWRCPASHPVPIPQITVNTTYTVEAGADASQYRLASDMYEAGKPGGITHHADVWIAWNEDIKATFVKRCINAGFDCHAYLLGDGRTLW